MRTRLSRPRAAIATAGVLLGAVGIVVTTDAAHGQSATVREFEFTGALENFVVPADVCNVTVDAFGAEGGQGANPDGALAEGGLGGRATMTISVTPGETLQVNVGGEGSTPAGGFNGGGAGGNDDEEDGGGGGGASDVRRAPNGLGNRLVVAGGGGGGGGDLDSEGGSEGGDGGGATGEDGGPSPDGPTPSGSGATESAGGAAPTTFDASATAGAAGQGGQGGIGRDEAGEPGGGDAGGGGGGGYFGGGGGAGESDEEEDESDGGGGGGGGSGFGPAGTVFETGVQEGDGFVQLTYAVEPGCDAPAVEEEPAAEAVAVTPRLTG